MTHPRSLLAWPAAALAGLLLLAWALPRALPLLPRGWQVDQRTATAVALERLAELGPPPAHAYVVTRLDTDPVLELRLAEALEQLPAADVRASFLGQDLVFWEVLVYPPGAPPSAWAYRARLSLDGKVRRLEAQVDPARVSPLAPAPVAARLQADQLLRDQGFDPSTFGEPEVRAQQQQDFTSLALRYPAPAESPLYPRYGVQVRFDGDRLAALATWYDEPGLARLQERSRASGLPIFARSFLPVLLVALGAAVFVRRYHEGEVGVRTGLKLLGIVLASALVCVVLVARPEAQQITYEIFTRRQATWVWGIQIFVVFFFPLALLSFLSTSLGEAACHRRRWDPKLAAFDALLQGRWGNATVARSALAGTCLGVLLAGTLTLVLVLLQGLGVWPVLSQVLFWPAGSAWFGLAAVAWALVLSLYLCLFGPLLLAPYLVKRLGTWLGGGLVAVIAGLVAFPLASVLPVGWDLALGIATAAAAVAIFLRFDLVSSLLAVLVARVVLASYPFLLATEPRLQVQGALALGLVALPLLLSVRFLTSGREFEYRYDDIPPHVRRIAERERQRVELETARRIQSSILPQLPDQLHGIELAHAYQPATEVGGDFYDVLALEDGRLAVAVGDVAGHGVASGLIMSVAKSALAVQVSFDPEVEPVFATLNRLVFQSARRRLLTTLCYGLVDPRQGRVRYASAGHLFPYRVTAEGRVDALRSVAYPLGVRSQLTVEVASLDLSSGDCLFLFSDGIIEARAEGSDELFGFTRLEQVLATCAGHSAARMRDTVLEAVDRFVRRTPQEDDRTVLVLRMP